MIKIVGYQLVKDQPDGSARPGDVVTVTANESKIQIAYRGKSIEVDPSIVTIKPDIAAVYEGVEQTMVLGWDSERFNTRDMASSIADRKGVADIVDYVCLVGFDLNDTYVVFRKPVSDAGCLTLVEQSDSSIYRPRDWIAQQSAALGKFILHNKAKRTMLAHTSTYDTVSALELQIDLLTQLVAKLMTGASVPSWGQTFIDSMQAQQAVQAGAEVAATAQIAAQKGKNRSLQLSQANAIGGSP